MSIVIYTEKPTSDLRSAFAYYGSNVYCLVDRNGKTIREITAGEAENYALSGAKVSIKPQTQE